MFVNHTETLDILPHGLRSVIRIEIEQKMAYFYGTFSLFKFSFVLSLFISISFSSMYVIEHFAFCAMLQHQETVNAEKQN